MKRKRSHRIKHGTSQAPSNDLVAPGHDAPPRVREMANEFHEWPRFARRARRVLSRHADLSVFHVTLTYPGDNRRPDWLFMSIHWLISKLRGPECLFVFLHKGKKGIEKHPHWHGVFLMKRSREWLVRTWRRRIGASKKGTEIGFLRGQDQDRSGRYFRKNVKDWVRYCCSRDLDLDLTLRERVVASGELEQAWREVFGQGSNGPYVVIDARDGVMRLGSQAPNGANSPASNVRLCRGCDEPLPSDYPSNKWYHDARPGRPACKALGLAKRRKRLKDEPTKAVLSH